MSLMLEKKKKNEKNEKSSLSRIERGNNDGIRVTQLNLASCSRVPNSLHFVQAYWRAPYYILSSDSSAVNKIMY